MSSRERISKLDEKLKAIEQANRERAAKASREKKKIAEERKKIAIEDFMSEIIGKDWSSFIMSVVPGAHSFELYKDGRPFKGSDSSQPPREEFGG